MRDSLGRQLLPEAVSHPRTSSPAHQELSPPPRTFSKEGVPVVNGTRRPSLSRFQFAISSGPESVRQAGVVESDSFSEAVLLLGEKIPVRTGDSLEIGVSGFPPARFFCVSASRGASPVWMPEGKMAA
jgi:hypothetical protein